MKRLLGLASDLAGLRRSRAPFKLTFVVTDECSCRCAICHLWQAPRRGPAIDEIRALFRANPQLSWINLSGGEVAERDDFAAIADAAARHTRAAVLDFPTAGQRPRQVEAAARAALATAIERVFVTVSIDGPPELHDRLRGTPGAFARALETIAALRAIGSKRLAVYAGLTFSSRNDDDPEGVVAALLGAAPELRREDLHFNVAHHSPHYYRNREDDRPDAARIARFFALERGRRGIPTGPFALLESAYWRLAEGWLRTGRTPLPCSALSASAYVDPDLVLYPCATWDHPVGDLRAFDYSLERALRSREATDARQAARGLACPNCWTPCEAYPTMLTQGMKTLLACASGPGAGRAPSVAPVVPAMPETRAVIGMRSSLAHHLRAALRRGQVARLAKGAVRAAAAGSGLDLPEPWRGPLLATFAITWRCPLACAMCDLPYRAGDEIGDAEVPAWIDAIADLGPLGLGFTGGEPLVRRGLLPAIEQSVRRGLTTHLNTSGTGLTDDAAARLAGGGIASINVSLDHDRAEEHDRLRGRTGAFDHALLAIERLAGARSRVGASFRLQVMMAVSRETLPRVEAVRQLVQDRGADALSLLPVHDFAAGAAGPGIPARQAAPTPFAFAGIENSTAYLDGVVSRLSGDRGDGGGAAAGVRSAPGTCTAPRTAVFVDPTGRVFACTPGATVGRGGIAATPSSLASIVRRGLDATVPRERCGTCWWNCHRELDIAIGADRMFDRP